MNRLIFPIYYNRTERHSQRQKKRFRYPCLPPPHTRGSPGTRINTRFPILIDEQRFVSKLAGFFAVLALTLACIGLYGMMTYSVVRRTIELGVRMALGAPRVELLWMVLRESLVLMAIGIAFGIPLSVAASRAIKAGLFFVNPADPLNLIAAVLIMSAALLAGSYIPARRATKVNPMVALRYE
jgi:ABC-type antimicrobial peptide transport system permease subunit